MLFYLFFLKSQKKKYTGLLCTVIKERIRVGNTYVSQLDLVLTFDFSV